MKKFFMMKETIACLAAFVIIFVGLLLLATLLFKEPVIACTVLLLLEVMIAVCLHDIEIWIHVAVLLVHLIIAVLTKRLLVMLLCLAIYVVTIIVLRLLVYFRKKAR